MTPSGTSRPTRSSESTPENPAKSRSLYRDRRCLRWKELFESAFKVIQQYIHHIVSSPVLLTCSVTMLALFCVDLTALVATRLRLVKTRKYFGFATTIVSLGLFATFVGILIGLYGFDSKNISAGVPRLLEGLRFAFAGSVLGMGLSLVLTILHKLFGETTEDEQVLHSINRKLGLIAEELRSPGELVRQAEEMRSFLGDNLTRINRSLEQALHQLAKGATDEVTQALERIIREFNNNLTTQFGDNFKQLNVACARLVDWQENYKEHVETAEDHLKATIESLDKSSTAARELTDSQRKTQDICRDVAALIKVYDVQIGTLETHLKSCKALGEHAADFLNQTQEALALSADTLTNFSGVIEQSVGRQSATLAQLTQELDEQLPRALGELENTLTSITNQFAADYRSLFQFITNK